MSSLTFSPIYHPFFEAAAYFLGFRLFLLLRRKQTSVTLPSMVWIWLAVGAILGAALGSKIVFWVQDPQLLAASGFHITAWMQGKTVVGGFLGGVIGVELTKKIHRVQQGTGDVFVYPMTLGLIIGRMGCFASGLTDRTYGLETALPWAVDFGDGLGRHPTQLYEIAFMLCLVAALFRLGSLPKPGDRFKLWMTSYLVFRLVIESIKPMPFAYFGYVSGIQLASLAGLVYYVPHSWRILRQKMLGPRGFKGSVTTGGQNPLR